MKPALIISREALCKRDFTKNKLYFTRFRT